MSARSSALENILERFGLKHRGKRKDVRSFKRRAASFEPLERRELLSITWTGGGANNNWSTAANWNLGRAPVNGDDVVLAGSAQTSTNDDLTGLQLNSIEFQNSGFSIGGSNLAVTSGIKVDAGVSGAAITAGVALNGTVNVDVEAGNLTLSGIVSGSGGLSKSGAGIETLTSTESYTGSTTVNAGTLVLAGDAGNSGHGTIPGSGVLTINNGGTVSVDTWNGLAGWMSDSNIPPVVINGGGTLTMNDGETCHLNSLTLAGGTLASATSPSSQWGSWTLDGEVHATANSTMSATAMFPGNSNSGGFNVDAGVMLNVSGTLVDIDGGAYVGSVVKNGLGRLALTGTNTYSGPTTINQGTITPSASQSLPSGWSDADIGDPGQAGSATYDGTTWTVAGGGSDIWNNSDQFNFASESWTGDGTIVAQVDSITDTDGWAKAGVMFRNDGSAGSAFVDMVASAAYGVTFQWRNSAGGGCNYVLDGINAPVWVKLVRSGDSFSGYYSTDDVNWTQCGSTQTIDLNSSALAGLAVTAHNNGALNTSTFTNVSVSQNALPAGWSDADIGAPSIAGSASYNGTTWTVNGSGTDIWNAPDQFNFASETLAGDGSIVAQITSQSDTSIHAKAGVMFSDSTGASSSFVAMLATPTGPAMVWRTGSGSTQYAVGIGNSFSPIWFKLTRTGETVTGYTSTDGVNWSEVSSVSGVVASTGLAGLAVCSADNSVLGTATFTNVSVSQNSLPAGWSDADIGAPSIAGSATYDGTTWTLNGGGSDIWNAPDQFNFASETLAGDGSIVAQITSQSYTSINAKAGVMFCDSTDPSSSYVDMIATPTGPAMVWRVGSGSPQYAVGIGTSFSPVWLKLTRIGNTVTGYTSTDGVNWSEVTSVTGVVATTGLAGLAVCSHNTSVLGTATFTNVAVTAGNPDTTPPSVPQNLVATPTANSIGLTWSASTDNVGVAGYEVLRNGAVIATVTGTSYTDASSSLQQAVSYQYTVIAFDAAGNDSAASAAVNAAEPDTIPPSVPQNLAAIPTVNSIALTWSASTDNVGVAGYEVLRNGAVIATVTGASYTDAAPSLQQGSSYQYTVIAFDAAGNDSAASAALNAVVAVPPTVPQSVVATPATNSIGLTWTASTNNVGIAGYEVLRNDAVIATVTGTAYTDAASSLHPGSIYQYTIVAFDAGGDYSAASAAVDAGLVVTPTYLPGLNYRFYTSSLSQWPNLSGVTPQGYGALSGLNLSQWAQNPDYAVQFTGELDVPQAGTDTFDIMPDGYGQLIIDGQLVTQCDLGAAYWTGGFGYGSGAINLTAGLHTIEVDYLQQGPYYLNQFNLYWYGPGLSGGIVPNSAYSYAPDTQAPTTPQNVTATPVVDGIGLNWAPSTDNWAVTGYDVLRNGQLIATTTNTSYFDMEPQLQPGLQCQYAVVAFDAAGNCSAPGTAATVTAPPLVGDPTLYWDPNCSSCGGSGTWDAVTPNWTTSPTGAGLAQAWVAGATAVFGNAAGTVTLSGPISATDVEFTSSGYVLSGALTALSTGTTIDVEASSATISAVIAGSGELTKIGSGTLVLSGGNTLTGDITIDQGTLQASAVDALGNPNVARDITVNSGATLVFGSNDVLGNAANRPEASLMIDGGTVTNNGDQYDTLGPVTLDGGTLTGTGGVNGSYQMYFLTGPVTVIGTAPSTISGSGPNSGIHLYAPTVFDVADVTGNGAADLIISTPLIDQSGGQGIGSMLKTGAGTLAVTPGDGLYSGGTTVVDGLVTGEILLPTGLEYRYFTGGWSQLPNFNNLLSQAAGTDHNFDIGVSPSQYNYGLQFIGQVNVPATGAYTFYTTSDDGSDLYIDGQLVVYNDGCHGMNQAAGSIALTAGLHSIEVDYFQAGGGEGLSVQWSSSTFGQEAIPDSALYHAPNIQPPTVPQDVTATPLGGEIALTWAPSTDQWAVTGYNILRNGQLVGTTAQTSFLDADPRLQGGIAYQYTIVAIDTGGYQSAPSTAVTAELTTTLATGLAYRYYTGSWTQLPNFSTLTPQAVGAAANVDLTVRQQDTNYAIQFTGQLLVLQSGTYTFSTTSDDGSALYIGGQLVVDNDGLHYLQEQSGAISLAVGSYSIAVDYFQGSDDVSQLSLLWSGPGIAEQTIPDGLLRYDPSTVPAPGPVPNSPIVDALNLQDPVLANLVQRLFAVNQTIDRNGMMRILEAAGTTSAFGVSAADMNDLRTILNNAAALNIPSYVQVLANDVVNGNYANREYQFTGLGNLSVGSSLYQLNELVDKWFLGTDLPEDASNPYEPYAGTLYSTVAVGGEAGGAANTPMLNDTRQGNIGNCWLIDSMGSVAYDNPTTIENLFVNNGDGTWTVRFFNSNGNAEYVTVNAMFPTYNGTWSYYDGSLRMTLANNVLWTALLEKAFAQWKETGDEVSSDTLNGYSGLDASYGGGGSATAALSEMTDNASVMYYYNGDFGSYNAEQVLINTVDNHQAAELGTGPNPDGIPEPHQESVIAYNSGNGTFLLWNPWGQYQGWFTYSQVVNDTDLGSYSGFFVADCTSIPISGAPSGSQGNFAEAAPAMLAPGLTAAASQEIAWALPSLGGDGLDNDWLPSQGNFSDAQLENGGISQEVANTSGALAGGSVPGSMEPNLAIATTVVSTTPGRHLSARTARETDMALLSLEADGFSSDWSPQTAAAQSATLSPALVDALMSKVPV